MIADDRHLRMLRVFCRWHSAVLDTDDATRFSIESLARRLDAGGMDEADTLSTLEQLDELLMGEIARRHR